MFHTNHLESGSRDTFLTWIHLLHVQILFSLEVNYSHRDSNKSIILGIYKRLFWDFCFFWGIFFYHQKRLLGAQESRNVIVSKSIGRQDLLRKKICKTYGQPSAVTAAWALPEPEAEKPVVLFQAKQKDSMGPCHQPTSSF